MKRFERFLSDDARGVRCVRAEDFDRVEAERDALQALLNGRDAEIDKATCLLRDVSGYVRHPDYDWFPCDVEDVAAFLAKGRAPRRCGLESPEIAIGGGYRPPEGATHVLVQRWFKYEGAHLFFFNEYGRWQPWTKSPRRGLVALK